MDIISLYKHRIDALMDILFGAGVSNPQTIIEQLNYLLFLRALSIKDDEAELLGITDESEKIFSGDLAKYRWQNLLALNAEDLFKTLETSFDLLQKKSKNPTVKLLFRNAHIKIFDKPTLRRVLHEIETFSKELDTIAHEGNKDVFGDMYEYLLSKLSSAGTNGQFRTPRHIIDFMVKVVDPKKNETILDPACGTAGFLVAAYRYIAGEYTSDKLKKAGSPRAMDKLSADEKNFLFNHMFTGFDSDEDMIKFGMMNLHLHGLTKSRLARQNSLTDTTGMKDKFDVILANPPFSGKIDEESVSEDLRMGTKATELLFLRFMMDHLSLKGKLAVIVPEGVVFNASKAHAKIRQMLIEKGLWAVVSLPSGVFNPYAGVKTSLLFVDKEVSKATDELLFIKIENDGFDLGAQRRPFENNDLPAALEILSQWKVGKKIEGKLATWTKKEDILSNADLSLSGDRYQTATEYGDTKWSLMELGDICEINPKKSELSDLPRDTRVSFVPMADLSENKSTFDAVQTKKMSEVLTGYTYFKDGDVLLAKVTPCFENGKAGIAKNLNNGVGFGSSEFIILRSSEKILPELVYYFVTSDSFRQQGKKQMTGTGGLKRIPIDFVKTYKVPVPPLEIQRQIVTELNSYQNVIDGAKQVVENWKPHIEIDTSLKTIRLGDISDKITKGTTPTTNGFKFQTSGINFIKIESITDSGDFIKEKFAHINEECNRALKRSQLKAGDVLFSIAGALGRVAVVDDSLLPANTNQALAIISPKSELDSRYLAQVLSSELIQKQINGLKVGVAQSNLSLAQVSDFQIPLPSLEVQRQIVEKMEAERAPIDTIVRVIPVFQQKIKDRLAKLWN
jgi:type I restriction enzyme M protein